MANQPLNLTAMDVRVFIPARDFGQSLRFYTALGWQQTYKADDDGLAILELADCRFYLQNFYVKDWAENCMIFVTVEDAQSWYQHISKILEDGAFGTARVRKPFKTDYGAIATHLLDPSGVLLNFSQFVQD